MNFYHHFAIDCSDILLCLARWNYWHPPASSYCIIRFSVSFSHFRMRVSIDDWLVSFWYILRWLSRRSSASLWWDSYHQSIFGQLYWFSWVQRCSSTVSLHLICAYSTQYLHRFHTWYAPTWNAFVTGASVWSLDWVFPCYGSSSRSLPYWACLFHPTAAGIRRFS